MAVTSGVVGDRGFGEGAAEGVDDHGVAGADFVAVDADPVGEEVEDAVVVGAGGEPAEEPAAAFVAFELGLDGVGVFVAVVPELLDRCRP